MKRLVGLTVLVVVALTVLLPGLMLVPGSIPSSQLSNEPARSYEQHILDATVRIAMYTPDVGTGDGWLVANGLGTLVEHASQTLLITHDHWGQLLVDATVVQLYSTANELLLQLEGDALRSLVRYRDGGTMVLDTPSELLSDRSDGSVVPVAASLGDANGVQSGDTVLVVRQRPGEEGQIEILEAEVQYHLVKEQRPACRLHNHGGQVMVQGDSGGGVWHNGRLVGNQWVRVVLKETDLITSTVTVLETDETVAAIYHTAITASLSAGSTVSQPSLDAGNEMPSTVLELETGELGEDDMWGQDSKRSRE